MIPSLTRMNPSSLFDAGAIGYSQISIIEPCTLAFISGQVAQRPGDETIPEDLEGQAAIVVENARAALKAADAAPEDLVMVRVYVVDLTPERQQQVMPYLLDLFDGAEPSVTGIGVAALAGPSLQLEVEMVARVSR